MKSFLLSIAALLSLASLGSKNQTQSSMPSLKFDRDGNFKIMVFADCQDDIIPNNMMMSFLEDGLKYENPDLVVFLGDNVVTTREKDFKKGAERLLKPVVERKIPFAFTFGNHDAEYGVSKDAQLKYYQSTGLCVTYDADPSITGVGTCNIPIYSKDGKSMAYNIWMIDSNMYDEKNGGYAYVEKDQLEYLTNRAAEINREAGKEVDSIAFQHIPVPEMYNLVKENPRGHYYYNGKTYDLALNEKATGYIGESPSAPVYNSGELEVLKNIGVNALYNGHDHSNSFHGNVDGVELVNVPGMSFKSYGDPKARGYGVITLKENNTETFDYRTVKFTEYLNYAIAPKKDLLTKAKIAALIIEYNAYLLKDAIVAKIKNFFNI